MFSLPSPSKFAIGLAMGANQIASIQNTISHYAEMAVKRENALWHYSHLLNETIGLPFSECQELFDLTQKLSAFTALSVQDTLDCVITGIIRGTYLPLDNAGLNCVHIKSDYDRLRTIPYDGFAWYQAVRYELERIVSPRPYTIKTQVIDLGNGYGEVDYVLGTDLLMPSDYKGSAIQAVLRPTKLFVYVQASDELLNDNIIIAKNAFDKLS